MVRFNKITLDIKRTGIKWNMSAPGMCLSC